VRLEKTGEGEELDRNFWVIPLPKNWHWGQSEQSYEVEARGRVKLSPYVDLGTKAVSLHNQGGGQGYSNEDGRSKKESWLGNVISQSRGTCAKRDWNTPQRRGKT